MSVKCESESCRLRLGLGSGWKKWIRDPGECSGGQMNLLDSVLIHKDPLESIRVHGSMISVFQSSLEWPDIG